MRRYPPSTIHIYMDLSSTQIIQTRISHNHNTNQPLQTLVQAPYQLPTYTTPTTATQPQTHVQHSPCSHKIGKSQTQSTHPLTPPPTPSTPLQANYIHISHTSPTPLILRTSLIHSTSAALDTKPELRVQHT